MFSFTISMAFKSKLKPRNRKVRLKVRQFMKTLIQCFGFDFKIVKNLFLIFSKRSSFYWLGKSSNNCMHNGLRNGIPEWPQDFTAIVSMPVTE